MKATSADITNVLTDHMMSFLLILKTGVLFSDILFSPVAITFFSLVF